MTLTEQDEKIIATLDEKFRGWIKTAAEFVGGPDVSIKSAALIGDEIVPCHFLVAMCWMDQNHDTIKIGNDMIGDVLVSTVFLPMACGDHFETMVFNGRKYKKTCKTLAEAKEMHQQTCELVRNHKENKHDPSQPLRSVDVHS